MTYKVSKCHCGHKTCTQHYLSGPDGAMSAFGSERLAQSVADFLNKEVENDAAVQIAEEVFKAGWDLAVKHYEVEQDILAHERAWNAFELSEAVKELTR